MKKGRHRRFEEARKLKQTGPTPADLGFGDRNKHPLTEEDEYAAIAERYGVRFDEEQEESDEEKS